MENTISQFTTKSGKIVSFRYPTIDDALFLKDYINEISIEKTFTIFQGEQKTLKDEKKMIESFLKNKNKVVIILAFIGNKLVGVSDISLGVGVKSHIGGFGITVAQKYRSEGIGKKLMELVIQESIKKIKGLKIMELEVFGDNHIALNLYKKMGFIEFGRLPNGLKRQDKFSDSVLMYKKLK
jgi:ribosomal protein S18 acetylase RimI-like enzyme